MEHPRAYVEAGVIGGLSALAGMVNWSTVGAAVMTFAPFAVRQLRGYLRERQAARIARLTAELDATRRELERVKCRRFDIEETRGEAK